MAGIYGSSVLNEKYNTIIDNTHVETICSIAYEEYLFYKDLVEQCTDNSKKPLLEAKLEVLYEVSIKDIKKIIIEAFRKIKDFLKKIIERIREFFSNKKQKEMEKQFKELEKELNNYKAKNNEFEKELNNYKAKSNEFEKELNNYKTKNNELEKEVNNYKTKNNELEKEVNNYKTKNNELEKEKQKIFNIISRIIDNDILYFDMYDYIKDVDPSRIIESNDFKRLMDHIIEDDKSTDKIKHEIELWMSNMKDKLNILTDDIKKSVGDPSRGGYDHYKINQYIDDNLSKIPRYKNTNDLLKRLEWLIHGFQVTSLNRTIIGYQKAVDELEKILIKYFDNKNIDSVYSEFIEATNKYIKLLNDHIQFFTVFVKYAGKAVGAADQAIIILKHNIGNENN